MVARQCVLYINVYTACCPITRLIKSSNTGRCLSRLIFNFVTTSSDLRQQSLCRGQATSVQREHINYSLSFFIFLNENRIGNVYIFLSAFFKSGYNNSNCARL